MTDRLDHSRYIYALAKVIAALGCRIRLFYHLLPHIGGRIDYRKRKIWINCPSAIDALMALAHEGGHWVAYLKYGDRPYNRPLREVLADHFGWELLLVVGADALVSHQQWLRECRENQSWKVQKDTGDPWQ